MKTVKDYAKKHEQKINKSANFTDFMLNNCSKYPTSPLIKSTLNKDKLNLFGFESDTSKEYTGSERSNMFE